MLEAMDNNPTPSITPLANAKGFKSTDPRVSQTQVVQRNIDTRSGNLTVSDSNGIVLEIGMQPDQTYNVTFFNSATGVPVAKFGEQTDDTYSLKFFDVKGIGLAQFGQFPGGEVALKVAEANVEVSTATDDELIFDSGRDIFSIAEIVTGTSNVSFPSHSSGASTYIDGQDSNGSGTLTMNHGLGYIPAIQAFILNNATSTYEPISSQAVCDVVNGGGLYCGPFSFGLSTWKITVDNANVYVTASRNYAVIAASQSVASQSGSAVFKVYCQKQSAN